VLGVVFAVMNLSRYIPVDRIGLGLAVTLEFLGPLGVLAEGSEHGAKSGDHLRSRAVIRLATKWITLVVIRAMRRSDAWTYSAVPLLRSRDPKSCSAGL
jgi:threonine/homoserine efflux transporter RhtA